MIIITLRLDSLPTMWFFCHEPFMLEVSVNITEIITTIDVLCRNLNTPFVKTGVAGCKCQITASYYINHCQTGIRKDNIIVCLTNIDRVLLGMGSIQIDIL